MSKTTEELAKILFRRKWKDRLWEDPCFITARGEATEDATAILQHLHDNPPAVMVEALVKERFGHVVTGYTYDVERNALRAAFNAALSEGKVEG